jgi:hypothetical protein
LTQPPVMPLNPGPPPGTPRQAPNKPSSRTAWIIGGVVVALFVMFWAIGTLGKDDDTTEAASTSSSSAPPTAAAPPPAPAEPTAESAPAPTTTQAAPAVPASDPRCAPAADGVTALVQAGLTRDGWKLTNATVIDQAGRTYLGATIVDSTGKTEERSDVWVIANGTVYASTGGARNNTTFPKASAAPLNISPGDEAVQAVDQCVVNQTLGR